MKWWKKPESWIYLLLLISPILDLISSVFHFGHYSISLFLRPLIPLGLLIYFFFKEKRVRPWLLLGSVIYLVYGALHLYFYRQVYTSFSYGNWIYEASYLCNYTYLIFTLFLFLVLFRRGNVEPLKKYVFYYALIYMVSIVLSLVTRTSFSTYVEGFGYRGWFQTGGAVGSILIGLLFILLPYLFQNKKHLIFKVLFLFVTLFYLMFLLGTRVGLLGGSIAVFSYVIFSLVLHFVHKHRENKIGIRIGMIVLVVLIGGVALFGSYSLERRKQLDALTGKIPGDSSGRIIYMAYDLVQLKESLDQNQLAEGYMTKEQRAALVQLDDYSTKQRLSSTDLRKHQFRDGICRFLL